MWPALQVLGTSPRCKCCKRIYPLRVYFCPPGSLCKTVLLQYLGTAQPHKNRNVPSPLLHHKTPEHKTGSPPLRRVPPRHSYGPRETDLLHIVGTNIHHRPPSCTFLTDRSCIDQRQLAKSFPRYIWCSPLRYRAVTHLARRRRGIYPQDKARNFQQLPRKKTFLLYRCRRQLVLFHSDIYLLGILCNRRLYHASMRQFLTMGYTFLLGTVCKMMLSYPCTCHPNRRYSRRRGRVAKRPRHRPTPVSRQGIVCTPMLRLGRCRSTGCK